MLLQNGWTALHDAARSGHVDVMEILLSHDPGMITKTDNVSEQLNYGVRL